MNRDFPRRRPSVRDGPPGGPFPRRENLERFILPLGTAERPLVNFLLQIGELQTKALNHRHYSRGRATTF
jgi:hypothetical protein